MDETNDPPRPAVVPRPVGIEPVQLDPPPVGLLVGSGSATDAVGVGLHGILHGRRRAGHDEVAFVVAVTVVIRRPFDGIAAVAVMMMMVLVVLWMAMLLLVVPRHELLRGHPLHHLLDAAGGVGSATAIVVSTRSIAAAISKQIRARHVVTGTNASTTSLV